MARKNVLMPFKGAEHAHAQCLQDAVHAAEKACLQRGLRLTPLRRQVLELVWRSHEPVKAYDVLERLQRTHRGAAPPTVYRALEFLQAEGFVHRIESLNAYIGCGAPQNAHSGQFLICRDCGEVAEIDDPEVRTLLATKARSLGFHIESETIEVTGACVNCRDKAVQSGR
jgi:Fur family transcriptional regulator, zinc uptake regulator